MAKKAFLIKFDYNRENDLLMTTHDIILLLLQREGYRVYPMHFDNHEKAVRNFVTSYADVSLVFCDAFIFKSVRYVVVYTETRGDFGCFCANLKKLLTRSALSGVSFVASPEKAMQELETCQQSKYILNK